jgi:membrane protease YdiL (CAAX protease family)
MDSRFLEETRTFGKKDAIIAICAVLFFTAMAPINPIQRILPLDWETLSYYVIFLIWPIEKIIISILPVIIILLAMKQSSSSIGIHKEHILSALRLGFLFSLIPVLFGVLPRVLYGGEFVGFSLFVVWLIRIIIMAASEDILFVGFLQTRLNGRFKSDIVAISVGAALFSFMHVPMWLSTGELSLGNLPFFGFMVILWFVMHFVLVAVYRRYNSLIPVTILHTFINLMISPTMIWTFAEEYSGYADSLAQTSYPVLLIAIGIWAFVRSRRSKKKLAQ